MLLILSNEKPETKIKSSSPKPATSRILEGPWNVELAWGPVEKIESLKLASLKDLATIKESENFAGTATYKIEFDVQTLEYHTLNLGKVHEIAEVTLNGNELGTRWWGERSYDIRGLLKPSNNVMEIKVTNLLFNYARSLKENPVAMYWTGRSRSRIKKYPSGLLGPVTLF
jgi:hypothetical protein